MIKLNFKTISPLLITNGNELAQNIDYIAGTDKIYKINYNKLVGFLAGKSVDFSRIKSIRDVQNLIFENKEHIINNCSQCSIDISDTFRNFLNNENRTGKTYISDFINSNGRFYIPASSVKGMLLTILREDKLGILNSIDEKFVITDSEYIDNRSFEVYRTLQRPPSINLLCMKPDTDFTLMIRKTGKLNIQELRQKLLLYSFIQIKKAEKETKRRLSKKNPMSGANLYYGIIQEFDKLNLSQNEYLVNIGFGGGSWYKIFIDVVPPKFKIPGKKLLPEAEAHTTFAIQENNRLMQLGWCKLKIEEV